MPTMSRFEGAFCRSSPWRGFACRVVLPWALQGIEPAGQVLEIGAGSGAMAAGMLSSHPSVTMTVTDFDDMMVESATEHLAPFGARATARQADATGLPFGDNSFDLVASWIMLHHTVEWEKALAEAVRVTRPGGHVVGYDLLASAPMRVLHQAEGARFRMMHLAEMRQEIARLPVAQALVTPSLAGLVVRFILRKGER